MGQFVDFTSASVNANFIVLNVYVKLWTVFQLSSLFMQCSPLLQKFIITDIFHFVRLYRGSRNILITE